MVRPLDRNRKEIVRRRHGAPWHDVGAITPTAGQEADPQLCLDTRTPVVHQPQLAYLRRRSKMLANSEDDSRGN